MLNFFGAIWYQAFIFIHNEVLNKQTPNVVHRRWKLTGTWAENYDNITWSVTPEN